MKDTFFIQFYSKIENTNRFELGNGFSDTYDFCKNKGDFLWINHQRSNQELENFGYSSDFIVKKGTVFVSTSYITQLYQVYLWALQNENVNFIVGGPVVSSNCFTLNRDLPKNISLVNNSVEEYFGIPNFSYPWKLEVPNSIPDNKKIIFSYALENKCYWRRCKFCAYSKYKDGLIYRRREKLGYKFVDVKYNGKKEIRLGADAISLSHLKNFIPNLPYSEKILYRGFMRATKSELATLRKTKNISNVRFTIGLEFPTERMWNYMDKGYNREDVLETLNFLSDNKVSIILGTIMGWNNLINEDIKKLEEFMDELTIQDNCVLVDRTLFIYTNTQLDNNTYEKKVEVNYGPFYIGFYPKLKQEQIELNHKARTVLSNWALERNIEIASN